MGEGRDKDKQEVGQQQQRPPPLPAPSSAFSFISHNIDLVGASALPASQPPTRPEVRGRRRDMGMVGKPQPGDFTCEMWHCCVEKLRSESFPSCEGRRRSYGPVASNNTGLHGTKGTKDRKLAAAFTPGHTGRCERPRRRVLPFTLEPKRQLGKVKTNQRPPKVPPLTTAVPEVSTRSPPAGRGK